jgi:hypothetical protein
MHPAFREFHADVQSGVENINVRVFAASCCERTLLHQHGAF